MHESVSLAANGAWECVSGSVSLQKLSADPTELFNPGAIGPRIAHLELVGRVQDGLRHNQTRVAFVVGGHDIPRRVVGTRGFETGFVRPHVVLPPVALGEVRLT